MTKSTSPSKTSHHGGEQRQGRTSEHQEFGPNCVSEAMNLGKSPAPLCTAGSWADWAKGRIYSPGCRKPNAKGALGWDHSSKSLSTSRGARASHLLDSGPGGGAAPPPFVPLGFASTSCRPSVTQQGVIRLGQGVSAEAQGALISSWTNIRRHSQLHGQGATPLRVRRAQ